MLPHLRIVDTTSTEQTGEPLYLIPPSSTAIFQQHAINGVPQPIIPCPMAPQTQVVHKVETEVTPLIDRLITGVHPSWTNVFNDARDEIEMALSIVQRDKNNGFSIYPNEDDIFKAFQLTPLTSVKVVIVGQDPYHQTLQGGVSRAVGLSFSVRDYDEIPVSLRNIYTEITRTVPDFTKPKHGDLTKWATRGVLLINSCLTVRAGTPKAHGDIWHGLINKVFKAIAKERPNTAFVMWGRDAQRLRSMVGNCVIFEAAHPAARGRNAGFAGCNHFILINEYLVEKGEQPIDWNVM